MEDHLQELLKATFESPVIERPKYFITRCWLMSGEPACWVLRAEGLGEAHSRSLAIRAILNHAYFEERDQATMDHMLDTVRQSASLLTVEEATKALSDIGVPVQFNERFHLRDDIAVIPFSVDTGFSPATVAREIARIPDPV